MTGDVINTRLLTWATARYYAAHRPAAIARAADLLLSLGVPLERELRNEARAVLRASYTKGNG